MLDKDEIRRIVNKSFYDLGYKKKYTKEYYVDLVNDVFSELNSDGEVEKSHSDAPYLSDLPCDLRSRSEDCLTGRKNEIAIRIANLEDEMDWNLYRRHDMHDFYIKGFEQLDKKYYQQVNDLHDKLESSLEYFSGLKLSNEKSAESLLLGNPFLDDNTSNPILEQLQSVHNMFNQYAKEGHVNPDSIDDVGLNGHSMVTDNMTRHEKLLSDMVKFLPKLYEHTDEFNKNYDEFKKIMEDYHSLSDTLQKESKTLVDAHYSRALEVDKMIVNYLRESNKLRDHCRKVGLENNIYGVDGGVLRAVEEMSDIHSNLSKDLFHPISYDDDDYIY